MGFLSSLLGKNKASPALSSDDEKRIALGSDTNARLKLATSSSSSHEILCYMAVKDQNADVRSVLAERLSQLLPELSGDKQSVLYKYVVEALGALALDEVLKVRLALSSVLKDYADAPPDVVTRLAKDVERQVSEPILRYCMALPDDALLEILKEHPASWMIGAIAGRPQISGPVSGAIIDTGDREAGRILIENAGANISLDQLRHIVDEARRYPEWQKPVAMRKNLPTEIAYELIGFVDQSVRSVLLERTDFPADMSEKLAEIVKRRVEFGKETGETPQEKVARYFREGRINEELIGDALAVRDYLFVKLVLSGILLIPLSSVEGIFETKSAKAITAMCWKSGLSMRTALRMQQDVAKVPFKELIYPRGGTDYPLSETDMVWQLDFIGVPTSVV